MRTQTTHTHTSGTKEANLSLIDICHVCRYKHTHTHTVHTHTHAHTVHTQTDTHTHAGTRTYTHTHKHTLTQIYIHTNQRAKRPTSRGGCARNPPSFFALSRVCVLKDFGRRRNAKPCVLGNKKFAAQKTIFTYLVCAPSKVLLNVIHDYRVSNFAWTCV